MSLSYLQAMDIIGGSVSKPSKMPWFGWSTSAEDCITGSKLRQIAGSVCSNCYACKGNYCFSNVKQSHKKRLSSLSNPMFESAMIKVMSELYTRSKKTYIKDGVETKENRWRWHDSGDIQSLEHLEMLNRIALSLPHIDYWLPTKEAAIVSRYLKKHAEGFAPNFTVRLSHPMIGESFNKTSASIGLSTVGVKDAPINCNAPQQGNKCLDCRLCWDKTVKSVNYPKH